MSNGYVKMTHVLTSVGWSGGDVTRHWSMFLLRF